MKKRLTPSNTLVAIDVGTTKICVLVAQKVGNNLCEIIGIGRSVSHGLSRGVVVDVAPAVHAIKAAVQEAELMAGCSLESAYVGISGAHISAHCSTGMVPIKQGLIREHDVNRVLAAARAIPLPEDEQIIHSVSQQFIIDGKHPVRDPLNMHGVRLECKAHIITGNITLVKNLIMCCQAAGVKVRDIILEPIASAEAVLSPDEQELGVGILDIGGGTSDFAIYQRGSIRHTKIFSIAGNLFTNDIALCLRTTRDEAERIKKEMGTVIPTATANEFIEFKSIDESEIKTATTHDLSSILNARAEELLTAVNEEISRFNLMPLMPAGLVLTGGGALLKGLATRSQQILGTSVRTGNPRALSAFKEELSHPLYATSYGLLLYALKQSAQSSRADGTTPVVSRIFWRMKSWVAELF
ncbi:TPA: cell division protein FtsA [Candidatus Dependentiae bacterium]|nr:MAG: Cell division protein ftsA [candidate division TM6 bacterium GW2011_GWF2_43_87]HBL98010.1 cell division protein FtsA [Candidatus Dependentiae bacterium]